MMRSNMGILAVQLREKYKSTGCHGALMWTIETLGPNGDSVSTWWYYQKIQVERKHNVQYRRGIGEYAHIYMQVAFGQ